MWLSKHLNKLRLHILQAPSTGPPPLFQTLSYLLLLHQLLLVLLVLLPCHPRCLGGIGGGGLLFLIVAAAETQSRQGVPYHALDQESHLLPLACWVSFPFVNKKLLLLLPLASSFVWVYFSLQSTGSSVANLLLDY